MSIFSVHFHRWKVAAANLRDQPVPKDPRNLILGFAEDVCVPKTDVLYRCECGRVKSEEIHGRWTLDQLTKSKPVSG